MGIESQYHVYGNRDKIFSQKARRVSPGSSMVFNNMHSEKRIVAVLDHLEKKGSIFLGKLSGVYAIKYFGEDDAVGEIQDLSTGDIEMAPGDIVKIVQPTKLHTKELVFTFERPSEEITEVPVSDVYLPPNLSIE